MIQSGYFLIFNFLRQHLNVFVFFIFPHTTPNVYTIKKMKIHPEISMSVIEINIMKNNTKLWDAIIIQSKLFLINEIMV